MHTVKKQFSLSSEQDEFIDSLVRKKTFKDKSEVVRHGIELIREKFQEMELEKMARAYSTDQAFIQAGKEGSRLQDL